MLEAFGEMTGADDFVLKIMESYTRYIRDQLAIIDKCQELYSKPELARALEYCLNLELHSANDFRDALTYFRQTEPLPLLKPIELPIKYSVVRTQTRPVSAYAAAMPGGEQL